ncbi:hypothetical protein AArcSl_1720 [Halalkaliarchaeum desulfuricum]|uniref:Uncharacterized protein n=1 Tax=Halalkaliarchaeum desulfuricum TaxID=2055893 RepID=A0A343TJS6_9EURY|nr:hypothetical protein [Halalkaliarchaeum desulfuricum]AUX09348.1 hypothetical protein AArcSl_1720 [Halalkaliarchaeum desulfuricum]
MTDWKERIRQLAPHWAAMFILMIGVLAVIEAYVMTLSFWQSLVIVFIIGFGYPPVVRRLGYAPPVWQRQ